MPADVLAIPQFVIELDGATVDATVSNDLARLEVDRAIFLPGMATLELHDPDLKWADDTHFNVGKSLKVSVGAFDDQQQRTLLFDGEIASLEVNIQSEEASSLLIRAYDKSHRMHRNSRVQSFTQVKDSEVISQVAGASGLQTQVTTTPTVRPYVLQDNLTDFDFVCRLARRNGMVVLPNGPQLQVKQPSQFTAAPIPLEYRKELIEFRPILSTGQQMNKVTVKGWDPKTKRPVIGQATSGESGALNTGWGKAGSGFAKSSFGAGGRLVTDVPFDVQGESDAFAQATLSGTWNRDMHGEGRAIGEPKMVPGSWLDLKKIGTRFSGKYFVTRVRHVYRTAVYETHFWISGLEPETAADLIMGHGGHAAPAAGGGVAIALVTNVNDPDNLGRVKIKMPWLDDSVESFWARLATPMAGPSRGIQFMPEINDEVLVAFDRGDRSQPFVIGTLWNSKDKPPIPSEKFVTGGEIVRRQIVTRAGHVLEFDDTKDQGKFSVTTPKKNTIVFDDGKQTILIADPNTRNSLKIESESGKITIKSTGDVTIEAGGKVTVNAKSDAAVNGINVKVEAKGNLELSGAMVKVTAKAMLDLSSTGITSVKGSLVKIN